MGGNALVMPQKLGKLAGGSTYGPLLWPLKSWLPKGTSKQKSTESHTLLFTSETLLCLHLSQLTNSQFSLLACKFGFGFLSVCASVSNLVFFAYSLCIEDEHFNLSFWLLQNAVPFTQKQNTEEVPGNWEWKGIKNIPMIKLITSQF